MTENAATPQHTTTMPQSAMVLAAGLGTRMRPLTDDCPKPMIPVAGKPLIDYTLDLFARAGVPRAVVNVHYLADQIEQHLETRTTPEVIISDERGLRLETGGGLVKALDHLDDDQFFCANTDAILSESDISPCVQLAAKWNRSEMDALLLLCPIENTSGYPGRGDFTHDAESHEIAFRGSAERAPFVFTGLQIISRELVREGPDGAFSTKLLWEKAAARGRLHGEIFSGFWMHVGDPDGLASAERRLTLKG